MAEAWAINADSGAPEYNAQELRRIESMHLYPGSSDRFGAREGVRPNGGAPISVSGTTWTQHDLTAVVYPGLTAVSGPYVVEKAEESGSLDPADGSNDRIDALDLLVEDDDEDGSGNRQVTVVYVAGTPASSPSEPALTTNALRLGTIDVPAGGSPSPSVRSLGQQTVAAGGIAPIRDDDSLPSTGTYEGAYADRDEALWRRTGTDWVPAASPNSPTTVTFTASGTFTKADYPWARRVRVRCIGGGGAGGGASATGAGDCAAGSGGGGGAYSESILEVADLDPVETVTVGSGGAGSSGSNGGDGTETSFGAHVTAPGGSGGLNCTAATGYLFRQGAVGGTFGTGDVTAQGGNGLPGIRRGDDFLRLAGHGGDTAFGRGGRTQDNGSGLSGGRYGGGGGGGQNGTSQSARSGGDGADGIVIVDVY